MLRWSLKTDVVDQRHSIVRVTEENTREGSEARQGAAEERTERRTVRETEERDDGKREGGSWDCRGRMRRGSPLAT